MNATHLAKLAELFPLLENAALQYYIDKEFTGGMSEARLVGQSDVSADVTVFHGIAGSGFTAQNEHTIPFSDLESELVEDIFDNLKGE